MQCPRSPLVPSHFQSLTAVRLIIVCCAFVTVASSQDVLTYRYNNARTGLDSHETILTPSNVNVKTFGKLFVLSVDGYVDAEPLYLSAVNTSSGTHNLLIVATENDSVYGFDADTGKPVWQISALLSGETASDDRGCDQVVPVIGITATPVISRPSGSNGVIYLVAMSKDSSGNYYQRLHALDAASGDELYNGPVDITAKYPGTGDNSSGGYVIFDPSQYKERSGLLLANGKVYLTWASHCDIRPYTGWIMAYNASTLAQTSVLNVTPNANEGAIWGSGAGLTYDGNGNIFALDANGVFDTTLNASGFPSSGDYGNAFLRISTKSGLAVADYFEMYNQQNENDGDVDLGSGGALLLPSMKDSSGKSWLLAAGAGKDGNLYLVNRSSMGKFSTTTNNIYQELAGALPGGIWNSPVYSGGKLFYGPVGSPILAFEFKDAKLLTSPVAQSAHSFAFPGATLIMSSDNGKNAILWATENTNPAVLHAYSASNLTELYNTTQAANGRDNFGNGNKYVAPTVANGKVYVPTTNGVGVFGLLSDKAK
jgi:PQQ-like domain